MTPGVSQNSGSSDPARIQMYFDTDDEEVEAELQTSSWAEEAEGQQHPEGQAGSKVASPEGLHFDIILADDYLWMQLSIEEKKSVAHKLATKRGRDHHCSVQGVLSIASIEMQDQQSLHIVQ